MLLHISLNLCPLSLLRVGDNLEYRITNLEYQSLKNKSENLVTQVMADITHYEVLIIS